MSIKPSLKFSSANPSPALSKRSAHAGSSGASSTFKPPSPLYHLSLGEETVPNVNRNPVVRTGRTKVMKSPAQRSGISGSHTELDQPALKGYCDSGSERSFPPGSYTTSINYQSNPLDNITTHWDDDVHDYSRSISGDDLASSVYDNSPVVYRPPCGKPPSQAAAPLPRRKQMALS